MRWHLVGKVGGSGKDGKAGLKLLTRRLLCTFDKFIKLVTMSTLVDGCSCQR